MPLEVKTLPTDLEWTAKISLEGRLDANTSADFEKTIEKILSGPVDFLILDLAKLTYISSLGIRALILANKTLAARDGKLFCTNLQPQITRVMEVIKQLPGLNVFGSDEEMDKYLTAIQNEILKKKKKK